VAATPTPALRWLSRSFEAVALAAFVVLFFVVPDGATPWVLVVNLVTFYWLFLRAIAVPDRILPWIPSYLSIEVLFFAFSYLIFYYQYQLFLFGETDLALSVYISNAFVDGSNKAITLATVGMLAFTIGYRILNPATHAVGADRDQSSSGHNEHENSQYFQAMAWASSVLLLALVALYLLAGWRSADEGRYTGTATASLGLEGTFVLIVMFCMIVAALWIYATAAKLRRPPMLVVGLVVAIAFSVRLLILGDRSSFLLIALVLVGGYVVFVRRASLMLLIGTFGIWMLVYQVIEVVRLIPNWYDSDNIWELMRTSPVYQRSSDESSFNITTMALRATVQVVPDNYDFTYGILKLVQFSSIIPFSGKLYLPYIHPTYTRSSDMLRDVMIGPWALWDPGTNVISDPYIDFGVPGVVVILFAIGLFAKAMRNYVARDPSKAHRVVMYLLATALFAELPILNIGVSVRILAWALIFSVLVRAIYGFLHRFEPPHEIPGKAHDRPALARWQPRERLG
jgi:oligosaccharide repeat unit polymerase